MMRYLFTLAFTLICAPIAALAAESCSSPKMVAAEKTVNRNIEILVTNAPIQCKLLPAKGKSSPCSFLCVSTYTMTDAQHRSAQVYLAGASGQQINNLGVHLFGDLTFIDRSLAAKGHALRINASDAARLQRQAKADQIDATQVVTGILGAYRKVSTK